MSLPLSLIQIVSLTLICLGCSKGLEIPKTNAGPSDAPPNQPPPPPPATEGATTATMQGKRKGGRGKNTDIYVPNPAMYTARCATITSNFIVLMSFIVGTTTDYGILQMLTRLLPTRSSVTLGPRPTRPLEILTRPSGRRPRRYGPALPIYRPTHPVSQLAGTAAKATT